MKIVTDCGVCLCVVVQKPLRRVPIEEIGVAEPTETQMFQKKLDTETRNSVRRDLDVFDSKFASGDATATSHTEVSNIAGCLRLQR